MSFCSRLQLSRLLRKAQPEIQLQAGRRPRFEPLEDRCLLSLTAAVGYAVGSVPRTVVAADFNNDGHLDLAVANAGSNNVSVLLGSASGGFGPAIDSAAGSRPKSLAVGDFDNDGNLDLAAVNGYSSGYSVDSFVKVMFGNGNGSFQTPKYFGLNSYYSRAESVAVGDFNNDGTMDLAVASNDYSYFFYDYTEGHTSVLLSHGDRTFSAPINTFGYSNVVNSLAVGYFNNDMYQDLVVGGGYNWDEGTRRELVRVMLGDGTGNFANGSGTNWLIEQGTSVAAGDLNGDGKTDLVAADYTNVNVRLGNGVGGFQPPRGGHSYAAGNNPTFAALGDFDRDGILDIATANYDSNDVSILRGRSDGAFLPAEHFALEPTALPGDFNLDGDVDGRDFLAWQRTPTIGDLADWRTNYGNSVSLFPDPSPVSVAVGDFNGDGWLDLATANANGNSVSILFNDQSWSPYPPAVTISIDDVAQLEGNGNKKTFFVFTITLSAAVDESVTMSYRTVNGTANNWLVYPTTVDNDYVTEAGTLSFAPGETSKTITIEVQTDNKAEFDEVFYVDLFDSSINSVFAKSFGIGTILNDDT